MMKKLRFENVQQLMKDRRFLLTAGATLITVGLSGLFKQPNVHADTTSDATSSATSVVADSAAVASTDSVTSAVPVTSVNSFYDTSKVDDQALLTHGHFKYVDHVADASSAVNSVSYDQTGSQTSVFASDTGSYASSVPNSVSVSATAVSISSTVTSSTASASTSDVTSGIDLNDVSAGSLSVSSSSTSVTSDAVSSISQNVMISDAGNPAIQTTFQSVFTDTNDVVALHNDSYYGLNQAQLSIPATAYHQENSLYSINTTVGQQFYGQAIQLTRDALQHSQFDFDGDTNTTPAQYGSQYLVRDVVVKDGIARFVLANGKYLTANVNYVKLININQFTNIDQ